MDQQKLIIKALLDLTKRLKEVEKVQKVIAKNVEEFKTFLEEVKGE